MAEDGLKTLKETAQDIAFNVEKQAKLGKRKVSRYCKKFYTTIDKILIEIGEYTYDEVTARRNLSKDDPFIKEKSLTSNHSHAFRNGRD